MTFENLKKRVASNIGYVDSDGDHLTTKDITETDIGNWINNRYLDDLFSVLAEQYPEDYEQTARGNFYKTSGTIATISDTTLTSADITFNNGMVGDRLYNSDQGNYIEIDSYTDTDEIEIASEQDDWEVGDAIYILGHEFALGGDADDSRMIRRVEVKYDADDEYYVPCSYRDQNALLQSGNETYSELHPFWYTTTVLVGTSSATAIGILPEPTKNVANGIRLRYIQLPDEMSDDDTVPRLPLGAHSLLVLGATADAYKKLRQMEMSNDYEARYEMKRMEMLANYGVTRNANPVRTYPDRRLRQLLDKEI